MLQNEVIGFCTISDNLFLYFSLECNRLFIYRIFYNKSYC